MTQQKILVVEDEASIQKVVRVYLESAGFTVINVGNGRDALTLARTEKLDLIVLDLNLPGMDGMEVTARLREESDVYILMLTARGEEEDRIIGLRMGADDYLSKPFSPRELVARVEAVLRRQRGATSSSSKKLTFAHLTIDLDSHELLVDGRSLELTVTEFQVLWELASHAGRILTRDQLLDQVWGSDFYGNDRVVDVYVGQVRRKLQELTSAPMIETVRGIGYKFVDPKIG
jgi:two-component system alkaline phosphatase synthesis response regulator PhoP